MQGINLSLHYQVSLQILTPKSSFQVAVFVRIRIYSFLRLKRHCLILKLASHPTQANKSFMVHLLTDLWINIKIINRPRFVVFFYYLFKKKTYWLIGHLFWCEQRDCVKARPIISRLININGTIFQSAFPFHKKFFDTFCDYLVQVPFFTNKKTKP